MARHPGIVVRALTWNVFHGRDAPPDPALFTWRSRLRRTTERNATHSQANCSLLAEFADVLAAEPWDVALLQELPPRWLRPIARQAGAHGASALTARNLGAAARAWAADRNPDLLAANEGGSNGLLVRPPWRIAAVRRHTLARRPERRRLLWARLERLDGRAVAVANLHASVARPDAAAREVEEAAARAVAWSSGAPLVVGGDLNLRPDRSQATFDRLRDRFGLRGATAPDAIDHLLSRGLVAVEPPRRLPAAWREVEDRGPAGGGTGASEWSPPRIRLSDHDAVVARFQVQ